MAVISRRRDLSTGVFAGAAVLLFAFVLAFVLQIGPFHLLRLFAWGLFVHGFVMLAGTAWILRATQRRGALLFLAAALVVAVVAVDAFVVEPHWLEIEEVRLQSDELTEPLTIAVVADLQTDRIGDYERRALAAVMAREPDLILLPGDFIHENDASRRLQLTAELRALLDELDFSAPQGAWAVRGNVDPKGWERIFEGTGVAPMPFTTHVVLDGFTLSGLSLEDSFDTGLTTNAEDGFHIVFGHAPDFALGDSRADLLIAGHTHGGQVRLPLFGPPITFSRVPRGWAAGVIDLGDDRTLVVSRGVGMERHNAPRMRFLCRPQIVFVEVVPAR
ncbi:MAG: hypothetical protein GY716_20535 [bacterium]|nr:hypothetical protein [bacterium]